MVYNPWGHLVNFPPRHVQTHFESAGKYQMVAALIYNVFHSRYIHAFEYTLDCNLPPACANTGRLLGSAGPSLLSSPTL